MATTRTKISRTANRAVRKADAKVEKQREKLGEALDGLTSSLLGKVDDVRRAVTAKADDGAESARKALDLAMRQSRKGVRQLEKRWKKMETKEKAVVVGGLAAALAAAAAAPTLIRKVRGR
jgi:hypothetical protein